MLSRLDYCNAVLCGLPQCLLYKLQKVQNTAACMIFKAPRTDHITPILHKLHWLPVCDRIVYKISTLCHTSLTGLSPHYLSDIITLYAPSRGLCSSSDTRLLSIHRPITKSYGQRTFAYQAPHVWNKLSFELRHKSMTSAFKSSLKTHIFHKNESDSTNTLYVFE